MPFSTDSLRRWVALPTALLLLTSCATVHHVVPPEDYRKLHWPNTYHVKTKGELERVSSSIESNDSSLVIVRPSYPLQDKRHYPVTIPYHQIESIETQKQESVLFIELGAVTGKNFGDESDSYARNRVIFELGYLTGKRDKFVAPRWDKGLTFYLGAGDAESRIGLKARARYRMNNTISFDVGAGPLFNWWDGHFVNGFVGGIGVGITPYINLRSEYMSFGIDEWKTGSGASTVTHPSGLEQVWYNGATFSGAPAWFAIGVAGAAFVALLVIFIIAPPDFSGLD
jgi:hypothetical protein